MATIKSSDLDFINIKNSIKQFLQQKDEFKDYNFEASGLSNILDVLAYNTHLNALIANFAINESYLTTAQLRSSVVSVAESMGYVPDSKTSASAAVNISVDLSSLTNQPSSITLPAGTQFTGSMDGQTYVFNTTETLTAVNDSGIFTFAGINGSTDVLIYEGAYRIKSFIVGSYSSNEIYVVPDNNMDIKTVRVKVYPNLDTDQFEEYYNVFTASTLNEQSRLYNIKESPNEYFELNFGEGNSLGRLPEAGNKVEVEYISTSGKVANGIAIFNAVDDYNYDGTDYPVSVTTVSEAAGGSDKEEMETIKRNAPYRYSTQNRMVTATDYSSLILRKFGSSIRDIKCWGGEDNVFPEFGVVFISVIFNDDVSASSQAIIKSQILELTSQFAVVTFDVKFADPEITYIRLDTRFRFNPALTTLSQQGVRDSVKRAIDSYMNNNINQFDGTFRKSNMLTEIDAVDDSVLSSSTNATMYKEYTASLSFLNTFTIKFPVAIESTIQSEVFRFNNKRVYLKSDIATGRMVLLENGTNIIVDDNIGEFDATSGIIRIIGLKVDAYTIGNTALRFFATPSNTNTIKPTNNYILQYDVNGSNLLGIIDE